MVKLPNTIVRMVLTVFEADKTLAGTGGMNDGRLAGFFDHFQGGLIRYLVVFIQVDSHMLTQVHHFDQLTILSQKVLYAQLLLFVIK